MRGGEAKSGDRCRVRGHDWEDPFLTGTRTRHQPRVVVFSVTVWCRDCDLPVRRERNCSGITGSLTLQGARLVRDVIREEELGIRVDPLEVDRATGLVVLTLFREGARTHSVRVPTRSQ